MPDPQNKQIPEKNAGDPPTTPAPDVSLTTPLFDGSLNATARETSPGSYLGNANYLFRNGDFLGAHLRLDTAPTYSVGQYGLNGQFGLDAGLTLKFEAQALPPLDTQKLGAGLQFGNGDRLNADWARTPNGESYGANSIFRLDSNGSGTASFRVDEPAGTTSIDTKLKFNQDFSLNADWKNTAAGQLYGADGTFKLGREGNGTANVRVDEPAGTTSIDTKLKFNQDFSLNADWKNTAAGQLYGADGTFKLGREGNGTASFRVDEPAGTTSIDTKLKFNQDFSLNADWKNTAAGQLYGADGTFKLGKEGNGTASFRVDEPAGTTSIDTKLKFNQDFSLNADWKNTAAGQLYGADGAFKLGKEGNGTAGFRVDEPNGTSMFNVKLKFDENFRLDADYTNTKAGSIYGADAAFKLGKEGSGTAAFRVDETTNTASGKTALRFGNGDTLNFDLAKTPNGSVYGADGAFGIANGRATGSFRIDEPNQSSLYKLGASFDNGNAFNAQLMSDRLGTRLGLDGKIGFDKGAGSVMLDGKFGPHTDLGASINYKNQNLEYSGQVRANNESGSFRISEFAAKVSTTGNERVKFGLEAGYRPESNEYYGKVGLTIQLGGGGSKRPITRADSPEFDAGAAVDTAVANFREKQATLLRPENMALYNQAKAGVETLNANGAKLPVSDTAASLVVLAKENGIKKIDYVALGNPTSGGQQNLFIGDGDPSNPSARKAFIDKNEAANTPMDVNLRKIAGNSPQTENSQSSMELQSAPVAKRGAM